MEIHGCSIIPSALLANAFECLIYERGRSFFSLYKASNDTLATLTTYENEEIHTQHINHLI